MKTLRTPDEHFAALPGYDFAPHYVEVSDREGGVLRIHYLDEGSGDAGLILCLHGEPSWSYLYRKMIPPLVAAGFRVVAPDLVGFGRSDKPSEQADYTYERHVAWMQDAILDHLDLENTTLFGQDWGGLIGLRLVAENPDRFARVVVGNTGLPTGDHPVSEAFLAWQKYSRESPTFDVGKLVSRATVSGLDEAETAAYDAPFPDDSFKAGARVFPSLVPTGPDDPAAPANRAAWDVLKRWDKPFITCFSDRDPVTAGGDKPFRSLVPGAKGQPHPTIRNAGHFLQEDAAPQLVQLIMETCTHP